MSDQTLMDEATARASGSDEFRHLWATLPLDSGTREGAPSLTIPVDRERPGASSHPAAAGPDGPEAPALVMLRMLGEGGMGVVHLARQTRLHREVAVKTAKGFAANPHAARALREEALITANLQHPNVIPIYAVEETPDGQPRIVMKSVEGTAWSDILDGSAPLPEDASADPLRWHLELLAQVANAIEYAHSRGILHRDLKPENVMIGRFGEVYVLDWGLAVSMREEDRGVLPMASDVTGIAGTPVYMAPEMTMGTGGRLGAYTDVYLLGAVLHEILTGLPPHAGGTVYEAMKRAYVSAPPTYPDTVPAELAQICSRALSREPHDRFGSAEELRAAIVAYLRHRTSIQLSDEASARLTRLEKLIHAVESAEDERLVRDLFAEARFGFEQALRDWADNESAKRGASRALHLMVTHEVRRRNLDAARSYLGMLESPPAELEASIAQLADELAAEQRAYRDLETRAREADRTLGASGRAVAAIVFGIGASGSILLIDWADVTGLAPLTSSGYVGWLVILAACTAFFIHIFRSTLMSNEVNRQIVYGTIAGIAAVAATRFTIYFSDLPVRTGFRIELIVYALGFAMLAVVSNYRIFVAAAVCALGAVLDAAVGTDRLHLVAACLFVAFGALAWAWATVAKPHR